MDWEVLAEELSSLGVLQGFRFSLGFFWEGGGRRTSIITPVIILRVILSGAPQPITSSVISIFRAVPASSVVVIHTVLTTKCSSATAYPGITVSVIISAASVLTAILAPILDPWHLCVGYHHRRLTILSSEELQLDYRLTSQ